MLQLTVWAIAPLIAAVICINTLRYTRKALDLPGIQALHWMMIAESIWAVAQLAGAIVTDFDLKVLALQVRYVGVLLMPATWFCFALTYARQQRTVAPGTLIATVLPALAFLGLVFTNPWHYWVWRELTLVDTGGAVELVTQPGPALIGGGVFGFSLAFAGTIVLSFVLSGYARYRQPLISVVIAAVLVPSLHLFYLLPWNPAPWFDPTPIGLAIGTIIIGYGLMRPGFLDLIPVIRNQVVEHLSDPVVIVNSRGAIVDINPAAITAFLPPHKSALKCRATEFLNRALLQELLTQRTNEAEVTLTERTYHVRANPLYPEPNLPGRMVLVFRDITERRDAELQLRSMQRKLERLAHTDSLTGLHNRRYFLQRLIEEAERVKRHGNPMSVLLFDLDFFKRVNDTHGHDIGDRVLQAVATVARSVRRVTDVVARIGGEEFALLLPETDKAGALKLAHRLRAAIAAQKIKDQDGDPVRVTTSVGVATLTLPMQHHELLLSDADRALYRAKNAGRNVVCFAE